MALPPVIDGYYFLIKLPVLSVIVNSTQAIIDFTALKNKAILFAVGYNVLKKIFWFNVAHNTCCETSNLKGQKYYFLRLLVAAFHNPENCFYISEAVNLWFLAV